MIKHLKSLATASVASLVVSTMLSVGASAAPLTWTDLTLINGWSPYSSGVSNPAGAIDSESIVYLRGAMSQSGSTDATAFVLPPNLRPSKLIYVYVDLCNAQKGRLIIFADGTTQVQPESSDARCFTSLEGVTFPKT